MKKITFSQNFIIIELYNGLIEPIRRTKNTIADLKAAEARLGISFEV